MSVSRRHRLRVGVAAAVAILLAAPAAAQESDLAALFPSQAAIEAPVAGRLVRLDLPAEVLAACRRDLSDLRLFDAAGREVPFVVESGAGADAAIEAVTAARAEVLEASREMEERERAPALRRETYVLAPPPAAPAGTTWDLVLTVGAPDFVARIEVRMDETDDPAAPMAAGSVFRLREVGAEKLRLPLPASGELRWRVALETEGARYLEPAFHYESRRRLAEGSELEIALESRSVTSENGATVIVLERPAGLVPERLRASTTTPFFRRAIEVWDEGSGAAGQALGRARLFRIEGAATIEDLEIAVLPARGEALRVVIDDGDSPPLADLAFAAVLPRPALLFALPPSADATDGARSDGEAVAGEAADGAVGDGAAEAGAAEGGRRGGGGGTVAAMLRFGGGRAFRPRYDVGSLPPPLPAAGESAAVAEALYDVARLPAATLGPIAPNPRYDPQPALAWARRAGAAIDPRLWSHRRAVEARPSPEGLSRLRLSIEDLGVARADLADLRILDGDQRQWAYLVERGKSHELLALAVEGPRQRDGASVWTLVPPAAPATADQLVLEIPVAYFDRRFDLAIRLEREERTIETGRLIRAAGDPRPVLVSFPATRFDRMELAIVDGDDAPLEIARVEARFPVPEVFFAAPEGGYALLVGHPEAAAPSYELERVRDVVLAVRAASAEAGPLERNAAFSAGARLASGEGWQRALLWGSILLLVGFLTVLTLRLARRA